MPKVAVHVPLAREFGQSTTDRSSNYGICSVIAHGHENRIEAFLLCGGINVLDHIADWDIEGHVLSIDILPTSRGIIVATISTSGIGIAWIEYARWFVTKNIFYELGRSDSPNQTFRAGSIVFLHQSCVAYFTLDKAIYCSSEIIKFEEVISIKGPLQIHAELGKGISSNMGEHHSDCIIIESYSVSHLDASIVMLCRNQYSNALTMRWCELITPTVNMNLSLSVSASQSVAGSGLAAAVAKNHSTSITSSVNNNNKNPQVNLIWEMIIPSDCVIATEPYNNDGRDSRKVAYLASSYFHSNSSSTSGTPEPCIRVCNVNGLVCEINFNWICSPTAESTLLGSVTGMTILCLPETDECSRRILLSMSVGLYLELLINDVSENIRGGFIRSASTVHERIMSPLRSHDITLSASFLPCCERIIQVSSSPPRAQILADAEAEEQELHKAWTDGMVFVGLHEKFGIQLLRIHQGRTLGPKFRIQPQEPDISNQSILNLVHFVPSKCFSSNVLDRFSRVRNVLLQTVAGSEYPKPDSLVAICGDESLPWGGGLVYRCDRGATLSYHARYPIEIDVEKKFEGSFDLISPSFLCMSSFSVPQVVPIVMTSRVLSASALIGFSAQGVVDVPPYMEIDCSSHTVAFVRVNKAMAAQICHDRIVIVPLEKDLLSAKVHRKGRVFSLQKLSLNFYLPNDLKPAKMGRKVKELPWTIQHAAMASPYLLLAGERQLVVTRFLPTKKVKVGWSLVTQYKQITSSAVAAISIVFSEFHSKWFIAAALWEGGETHIFSLVEESRKQCTLQPIIVITQGAAPLRHLQIVPQPPLNMNLQIVGIRPSVRLDGDDCLWIHNISFSQKLPNAADAFKKFDLDQSGSIDLSELRQIFIYMGTNFSDAELETAMGELDSSGDGVVDESEFVEWWTNRTVTSMKGDLNPSKVTKSSKKKAAKGSDDEDDDDEGEGEGNNSEDHSVASRTSDNGHEGDTDTVQLIQASARKNFKLFDADGSGAIDASELRMLFSKMEANFSEEEFALALKHLDSSGDGQVDEAEFVKWWTERCLSAMNISLASNISIELSGNVFGITKIDSNMANLEWPDPPAPVVSSEGNKKSKSKKGKEGKSTAEKKKAKADLVKVMKEIFKQRQNVDLGLDAALLAKMIQGQTGSYSEKDDEEQDEASDGDEDGDDDGERNDKKPKPAKKKEKKRGSDSDSGTESDKDKEDDSDSKPAPQQTSPFSPKKGNFILGDAAELMKKLQRAMAANADSSSDEDEKDKGDKEAGESGADENQDEDDDDSDSDSKPSKVKSKKKNAAKASKKVTKKEKGSDSDSNSNSGSGEDEDKLEKQGSSASKSDKKEKKRGSDSDSGTESDKDKEDDSDSKPAPQQTSPFSPKKGNFILGDAAELMKKLQRAMAANADSSSDEDEKDKGDKEAGESGADENQDEDDDDSDSDSKPSKVKSKSKPRKKEKESVKTAKAKKVTKNKKGSNSDSDTSDEDVEEPKKLVKKSANQIKSKTKAKHAKKDSDDSESDGSDDDPKPKKESKTAAKSKQPQKLKAGKNKKIKSKKKDLDDSDSNNSDDWMDEKQSAELAARNAERAAVLERSNEGSQNEQDDDEKNSDALSDDEANKQVPEPDPAPPVLHKNWSALMVATSDGDRLLHYNGDASAPVWECIPIVRPLSSSKAPAIQIFGGLFPGGVTVDTFASSTSAFQQHRELLLPHLISSLSFVWIETNPTEFKSKLSTSGIEIALCLGSVQSCVRYIPRVRLSLPGTVQDAVSLNSSHRARMVLSWRREGVSGDIAQGLCILDQKTLLCLWRAGLPSLALDVRGITAGLALPYISYKVEPFQQSFILFHGESLSTYCYNEPNSVLAIQSQSVIPTGSYTMACYATITNSPAQIQMRPRLMRAAVGNHSLAVMTEMKRLAVIGWVTAETTDEGRRYEPFHSKEGLAHSKPFLIREICHIEHDWGVVLDLVCLGAHDRTHEATKGKAANRLLLSIAGQGVEVVSFIEDFTLGKILMRERSISLPDMLLNNLSFCPSTESVHGQCFTFCAIDHASRALIVVNGKAPKTPSATPSYIANTTELVTVEAKYPSSWLLSQDIRTVFFQPKIEGKCHSLLFLNSSLDIEKLEDLELLQNK